MVLNVIIFFFAIMFHAIILQIGSNWFYVWSNEKSRRIFVKYRTIGLEDWNVAQISTAICKSIWIEIAPLPNYSMPCASIISHSDCCCDQYHFWRIRFLCRSINMEMNVFDVVLRSYAECGSLSSELIPFTFAY